MAHVPVLAPEVAELLDLQPGDTVVDCTFGAGGHAALLEPMLHGDGTYIAIDRDPEAQAHFDRFAAARRLRDALHARQLLARAAQPGRDRQPRARRC